jgi:hypothetical protein
VELRQRTGGPIYQKGIGIKSLEIGPGLVLRDQGDGAFIIELEGKQDKIVDILVAGATEPIFPKPPAHRWVAEHNGDIESFYDESNLQGLCKPCHDLKTRRGE